MDERSRHRQFEAQFHRQLRARAGAVLQRDLPADGFAVVSLPDGIDHVRATLTGLGHYDRKLLDELPGTQAMGYRFRKRVFGPISRVNARLRAQVLAPIEALIEGQTPGPVGREEVLDALARYELLPKRERPTAVAFASATGFTAEAKSLVDAERGPTLILMGGREDGGWDVTMPTRLRSTGWAKLFELETQDERLKRLLYHLDKNASLLDSRGISVPELAAEVGLSEEQTEALVRRACRQDTRLLTVVHEGTLHLSRSPLADEGQTMSLWSRIRKLLGFKPTVAEQVRMLTTQRVQLEQQRKELDERVDALETEEREAVEKGAAASTVVEKKQLAGKLVRTRRQLRRVRAQANVFSQQLDIIGTHIHHMTLAQQGKQVSLPSAEDLTQEAAQAEQIMAELSANADLAAGIEVGAQTPMMDEEEAAILAEFEQAAAKPETTGPEAASPSKAPSEPAASEEPPPPDDKSKARPEMS